jgi:hypothetical protein
MDAVMLNNDNECVDARACVLLLTHRARYSEMSPQLMQLLATMTTDPAATAGA